MDSISIRVLVGRLAVTLGLVCVAVAHADDLGGGTFEGSPSTSFSILGLEGQNSPLELAEADVEDLAKPPPPPAQVPVPVQPTSPPNPKFRIPTANEAREMQARYSKFPTFPGNTLREQGAAAREFLTQLKKDQERLETVRALGSLAMMATGGEGSATLLSCTALLTQVQKIRRITESFIAAAGP